MTNWHTSDEALDKYLSRLETPPDYEPLVFPYTPLHQFEGYAMVLEPGIVVTVVGMSGGMKTAFVETITDNVRRMGQYDIVWWGTEWTWVKMADRAIQRYGGAKLSDMALHELYLNEKSKGISKRFGRELPKTHVDASKKAVEYIRGWPGKSHMTEELISNAEDLLLVQHEHIHELREAGRDVRICVWDYLQLLDLEGTRSDKEKISELMGRLQKFCAREQVIGITASQVTKASSWAAKKEDEKLTAESGQNFRSDESKLVITLRPKYERGLLTPEAEINVDKNNAGRTGTVTVAIKPNRFLWTDRVIKTGDYTEPEPPPF